MANRSTSGNQFSLSVSATIQNLLSGSKTASASLSGDIITQSILSGVSANQINRVYDERSISLEFEDNLVVDLRDLAARDIGAGSGNDGVGQVQLFEEIVGLVVHHVGGNGTLEINSTLPADPIPWIPQYSARHAVGGALRAGGIRVWFESDTQGLDTSSGGRNVQFTVAEDDSVLFDLLIFGRHDDDESSSSSQSSSSQSSSSVSSGSSSSS
jgi:hypothetical protein